MKNNITPLIVNGCCINRVIPLAFDESMSYLEQLCGILNKLNETINQVNSNTNTLNNIDINFNEIYKSIENLQKEYNDFTTNITNQINTLNTSVDNKLSAQYNQITKLLSDYEQIFNNQLNKAIEELEKQIDDIIAGQINAYDPTTGKTSPLDEVLQNIYSSLRQNAISCIEFDSLELTAQEYDNKEITAFNFDINGKLILMPNN